MDVRYYFCFSLPICALSTRQRKWLIVKYGVMSCIGWLHRHEYIEEGKKKSMLLFVNPNDYGKRDKLTLKVSFDDGMTWPKEHWILFDQYRSAGYSCITSIDENSIGILYESSQSDLAFIKIDLTEILK